MNIIVCYSKCESCMYGCCYSPPLAHSWANSDDIQAAAEAGEPPPTGLCACPCAQEES